MRRLDIQTALLEILGSDEGESLTITDDGYVECVICDASLRASLADYATLEDFARRHARCGELAESSGWDSDLRGEELDDDSWELSR